MRFAMRHFLCLALLALLLSGGSPALAGEKTEISFWAPFSGGDGDFMKELVAKYNAEQDKVEVKFLIHKFQDYYIKLRTAAGSGRGPDLAIVHASQIASMMKDNLILPVDDLAAKAGVDWGKFDPNILSATVVDGKHMSIPLDTHAHVLYLNKKILGDAGVLNADGTLKFDGGEDAFFALLNTIKEKAPAGTVGFSTNMDATACFWMWWGLYSQKGGKLFTADGKKAAFNNADSADVLRFIARLVSEGHWPKGLKSGYEAFKAGKGAMIVEGVWATGDYERAGLDFAVVPLPNIFGKQATWGDSHTLAVTRQKDASPAREQAAVSFAYWLARHGYDWALAGQIPSMPGILASPEFKKLPYRSAYPEIIKGVSFFPASEKLDAVKEIMTQNFNQFIATYPDPVKFLDKMEKDVNRVLER